MPRKKPDEKTHEQRIAETTLNVNMRQALSFRPFRITPPDVLMRIAIVYG